MVLRYAIERPSLTHMSSRLWMDAGKIRTIGAKAEMGPMIETVQNSLVNGLKSLDYVPADASSRVKD